MEEATKKLLEECSSGCRMAVDSMEQVKKYITGDKMENVISDYKEKHKQLGERVDMMLRNGGSEPKEPGMAASAFSWITTEVKMKMNDDDSQISKLMMNGCNMGIQSISGFLNQYNDASQESKALARELVRTEESFMKDLKQFLY